MLSLPWAAKNAGFCYQGGRKEWMFAKQLAFLAIGTLGNLISLSLSFLVFKSDCKNRILFTDPIVLCIK